jgi:hypothetical protein
MGVKVRARGVHSRPLPSPEHTPHPNRIAQDATKGGMVAGKKRKEKGWMENPYQ